MFAKFVTILSSLVIGVTSFLGISDRPIVKDIQGQQDPITVTTPEQGDRTQRAEDQQDGKRWSFRGDKRVRRGLMMAAMSVTGTKPVDVMQALEAGQSLAEFVQAAGKTVDELLAVYDETVQHLFDKVVEKGALPESLVQGRLAWYKEAARQMVDLPGLLPPYPALQELQMAIIVSTARVGSLEREQIKEGLKACRSLEDLLGENGRSGQEAVDAAMSRINTWLDRLVTAGKLSQAHRDRWSASIGVTFSKLVSMPGLLVAGGECSE